MFLIKNTNGKKSISLTMVTVSFVLISLWLISWLIGATFGLTVPAFDVTVAMGYFTPLATLYFGRRWTDKKSPTTTSQSDSDQ